MVMVDRDYDGEVFQCPTTSSATTLEDRTAGRSSCRWPSAASACSSSTWTRTATSYARPSSSPRSRRRPASAKRQAAAAEGDARGTAKAKLTVDQFSVDDLVLRSPESYDPATFDLDAYDDFIEAVVAGRDYSYQAIRTALDFLAGGRYANTEQLAEEAFASTPATWSAATARVGRLLERLPFPDKLACSLDLATGTGKSYVMFCLARIMLNEGLVNRVLLLCPSLTIEDGPQRQVRRPARRLRPDGLLPERNGTRLPDVVDAAQRSRRARSASRTSTPPTSAPARRIARLLRGARRARRSCSQTRPTTSTRPATEAQEVEGVRRQTRPTGSATTSALSGTCYVGNEYFADVVYRYSIRDAINDRWVKEVFYLAKDESSDRRRALPEAARPAREEPQDLQAAQAADHRRHQEHQGRRAARRRPGRVPRKQLPGERDGGREQGPGRHVLGQARGERRSSWRPSTTATSPVEWIVSVAMLTEGWDVKNVFQIYPHEKRAFNSKLLIAQVLGRGLRRPDGIRPEPRVYVFNHQRWAPEVEELVAEVLDQETTIAQRPTDGAPVDHFDLHRLTYKEVPTGIEPRRSRSRSDITKSTCARSATRPRTPSSSRSSDPSRRSCSRRCRSRRYYPMAEVSPTSASG